MAQQDLHWQPASYYRLRDSRLTARIVAVETNRLVGEIVPFAKLRWLNEEPTADSSESEGSEQWDLHGDCTGGTARDLMELIR